MNKLLLCLALCAAPVVANATDMPLKAPPRPMAAAPVLSWTGWYGGLSAGWIDNQKGARETFIDYGSFDNQQSFNRAEAVYFALPVDQAFRSDGALWGLTLGANMQVAPAFVIGIEG